MRSRYRAALVISVGFCLPFLGAQWFADDLFHQWVMRNFSTAHALVGMFGFGDPAHRSPVQVWWIDPELRLSFFRPVTSGTYLIEHALGVGARGQHAVNLVLWGLLLVVVAQFLRRVVPSPRAALIAFAVYAFSDLRAFAIGWISLRHLLLSSTFALLSISEWHRFRTDGRRSAAVWSVLAMCVGILASENALAGLAYIVAFELLCRGRAGWKAIATWTAFALTYVVVYSALGFGTSHSGLYTDLVHEPMTWVRESAMRIPAFAGSALAGLPLDLWLFLRDRGHLAYALVSAALLALLLPALRPWKASPVRWLALAAAAALVPVASASASSRLLTLPGVAIAVVIGTFLDETPLRGYRGAVAGVLWARHVIVAPLLLLLTARAYSEAMASSRVDLWSSPALQDLNGRHVIMLDVRDPFPLENPHGYFWELPRPPLDLVVLNAGSYPIEVERIGPASLRMRTLEGELLSTGIERNYRSAPVQAGFRSRRGLPYVATVEAVNGLGATQVRFDFSWPLDDPGNLFLHWDGQHYVGVTLPASGPLRLEGTPPGIGRLRLK
jgi:hypothetical protein